MWDVSRGMTAEFDSKNELNVEDDSVINYDYLHDNQIRSHKNMDELMKREFLKSSVEQKRQQNKIEEGSKDDCYLEDKQNEIAKRKELRDTASKDGTKRVKNVLDEKYIRNVHEPIESDENNSNGDSSVSTERYNRMENKFERSNASSSVINSDSLPLQVKEVDSRIGSLYWYGGPEGHKMKWPDGGIARAQTPANNNLPYGESPFVGYFLTLGLPILCSLIFLVMIWRAFKYFTKIQDQIKKEKAKKQNQEPQVVIDIADKLCTAQSKINLSCITNGGVVLNNLETNSQLINQENKNCKLEIDQLSLSMEQEVTSNDSDEQSEWRTLTRKFIGGFKMNVSRKTSNQQEHQNDDKIEIKGKGGGLSKQLGKIKYSINYDFSKSILLIEIIEAADLPGLDLCGSSDPYVKIYFEPDRRYCEKTRVHKSTLNPIFDEKFEFNIPYLELTNKTLVLAVYDYDKFSKHDEIGQVIIPINSIDLAQIHEEWKDLTRITSIASREKLGDICLSLRYVPTASKLTVVVLEGRELKKMDIAGLSDPYVKLVLMNNDKRLKKKKTSIKRCTLNPHYNEAFTFDIPVEQIQKVKLVITVVDYDRIGASETIGRIVLGYGSSFGDLETKHWKEMLANPRRPIAQWHALKSTDHDKYNPVTSLGRGKVNRLVGSRSIAL